MSNGFNKKDVIVASDGTEAAESAVKYVDSLLHPDMHRIVALRVVEEPSESLWRTKPEGLKEESLQQIKEESLQQLEEEARRELKNDFEHLEDEFDVEKKVLRGEPQDRICEIAEEFTALGIIMGRREFAGRQEVLLGSVSNYVTHNAPCPVTVVPRLNDLSNRKNIIVASDGTEAARNALQYVESLLHPDKHRLVALRVIEPPSQKPWQANIGEYDTQEVLDSMVMEARTQLDSDFRQLESDGFEVERKVLQGKPQITICDTAEETNALGIIMGRGEFDDRQEVLLGSVSNYVAHNASCPVSVVPRSKFQSQ